MSFVVKIICNVHWEEYTDSIR